MVSELLPDSVRTDTPFARRAGTTPARTTDDLPHPEGPEIARKRSFRRRERIPRPRPHGRILLRVIDAVRRKAAVGTLGTRGGGRPDLERGILSQDRPLEGEKLAAGVDAELVGEPRAGGSQCGEGVRLPPAAVEGEGEEAPPPLAQGFRAHEPFGIGHHRAAVTGPQPRLDQVLVGHSPHLVESAASSVARGQSARSAYGRPRQSRVARSRRSAARAGSSATR